MTGFDHDHSLLHPKTRFSARRYCLATPLHGRSFPAQVGDDKIRTDKVGWPPHRASTYLAILATLRIAYILNKNKYMNPNCACCLGKIRQNSLRGCDRERGLPARSGTHRGRVRDCYRAGSRHAPPVLFIDIESCPACGGAVRIIACIQDPVVIQKILDHLKTKDERRKTKDERRKTKDETCGLFPLPESRAPPGPLFG
jgi:hypothetical protein